MVKEIKIKFESKMGELKFNSIPVFKYNKTLSQEVKDGNITRKKSIELLEQMLAIRTFEEMLVEIMAGIYSPLPGFKYVGPTHLSIGQEATSVGSISNISADDYITSSHRGHGDAISKGYNAIKLVSTDKLKELIKKSLKYVLAIDKNYNEKDSREILQEKALKIHIYRMIAELFGRSDGYCRGVGGGMHIADFELGHLGANAIVGGHMAIAAGAAISCRYQRNERLVLCLAGDGAYSNGIAHESMNLAAMAQFSNGLMDIKYGVPVIFAIVNNGYAMSGQEAGEITGLDYLARRGAAYNLDSMHAEVVDGMNVVAVMDATKRAGSLIKKGKGPVLLEFITYRYKGHSLSDPLSYRDRSEMELWQEKDPIKTFSDKLLETTFPEEQGGKITEKDIKKLKDAAYSRNAQIAKLAAEALPPSEDSLLSFVFSGKKPDEIPKSFSSPKTLKPIPSYKRDDKGQINTRLAIREALVEEMARDGRVVLFGEDVADYGGAFGVTNELLGLFGRNRVFNTSISESGIVGAAVGMAMTGLIPIAEIMYDDFILMAMDQIGNQAAKWSYMSGGQISIPMVIRTTIGGGKGYAGQHSQSLEAIAAHMPGLIVIAPSNAYDAKGLLKSAIRGSNPVIFFEHQFVYNLLSEVPDKEYLVPIGKADIKRQGSDITIVSWSNTAVESIKAAEILDKEGVSAEVIDIRTLVPLDIETIINSVKKTGRVIVTSQEVTQGSFAAEVASQIQEKAFDYLDGPVLRLCAPDGIPPSASNLEKLFLPDAEKLVEVIRGIFN
ncbi:MAG: dehydrogenase E1 component subunit alpha/beta [Actinobacteria bacterium]|nr:dehydrogenase E1 component subunit alpha/beta [Actinomycetota bacterium]